MLFHIAAKIDGSFGTELAHTKRVEDDRIRELFCSAIKQHMVELRALRSQHPEDCCSASIL
jgi:hypothetical protein